MTGRAIENMDGNKKLLPLLSPQLEERPWGNIGALKLSISVPGSISSMLFVQDSVYETMLGAQDVEIEAHGRGLSEHDVHSVLSKNGISDHFQLGGEFTGVVTQVHTDCDPTIRRDDLVYMSALGCMR